MNKNTLNNLAINGSGIIKSIEATDIKRRLMDIGLTNGTNVEKVLTNFTNNMSAYFIRGALIAIRNEDAETVLIEVNSIE